MRQVVAIGVESVGLVCGVAVFVGITVVVQLAFWVAEAGQSQMLGPLLVAVVARELSPVLIDIVVIVRSGSAMAAELGIMKIGGRVHVLEAQGISPSADHPAGTPQTSISLQNSRWTMSVYTSNNF